MKKLNWKNGLYSLVWEEIPFVISGDVNLINCIEKLNEGYTEDDIITLLRQTIDISFDEAKNYIEQISEALAFANNYDSQSIEDNPNTQSMFTLNLTRNCNLNCKHCYAGGALFKDEMTVEQIEDVIDFMARRLVKPRLMVITGGEPTLEKNKLRHAISCGKSHGLKMRVNSNGLLIDDNLARFFHDNGVMVQLSMDGIDAKTHALLRNSEKSFEGVLNAIRILKNNKVEFALSFTIHSQNICQLPQMIEFALNIGAEKLNTSSLVQIGNAKLNDLGTVDYEKEFKILYDAVKDDKTKQHLTRATLFAETVIAIRDGIKFTQCGTGNCTACVDSTGEIYPCLNMMMPEFRLAEVKRGNIQEQYMQNPILTTFREINIDRINEKCSKCFFRYWCGGFCRGETIANGGKLTDPYSRCASWKKGLLFILKCLAETPDLYEQEGLYE